MDDIEQLSHTIPHGVIKGKLKFQKVVSEFITSKVIDNSPLKIYEVHFEQPDRWEGMIAEIQEAYLKDLSYTKTRSFKETIDQLTHLSITKHHFDTSTTSSLFALAYAAMNLEQIYFLLVDPNVTEILSNQIGNDIIITHLKHGRCRTNLKFDKNLWTALKIRAEYDSGRPLNAANPALKIGIETHLGNLRISLQVDPLSTLGPTFSLRRLPKVPIKLPQLLEQGQISKIQADILKSALANRKNIIIAGEPGSGKTTLANALLYESDKYWRLITLEDAKEISLDSKEFPLLMQYSMPTVGSADRFNMRSNEIARLLHRSPDYVFLGEIQNKDDTTVAFEGFAAGIRGMATTHAKNIEGLRTRWIDSHQLPPDLLLSLDLIVMTSRTIKGGKIDLGIQGIYQMKQGEISDVID